MKAKRILIILLAIVFVFGLTACGGSGGGSGGGGGGGGGDSGGEGVAGANVAFVIPADDALGINDKGWIQMTWTGVKTYCEENGKTSTWYRPVDNSMQGYLDCMATAINSGTEVIVSLGFQPTEALAVAQYDYPDTYFISVEPDGMDDEALLAPNHYAIFHQTDQAGFLAGVAAIKGGFKDIGVLHGLDVPGMNIWVYGYIQGFNYAAGKLGVTDVKVRHFYANTATASPDLQALAASWYEDGCDLILTMLAGGNNSLFAAADAAGKPCFGADVDQGIESDMVLTSPVKRLEVTVPRGLATVYDGTFKGGVYRWFNVDDDAVGLATGHWRVPNYTVEEYEQDFQNFVNDVDGVRSGMLTEQKVRTDQSINAIAALWDAMPEHNIELNLLQ